MSSATKVYGSSTSINSVFQNYYNGESLNSSATVEIEMYAYPVTITRDSVVGDTGTIKMVVDLSNKSSNTSIADAIQSMKIYYTLDGSAPTTSSSYINVAYISSSNYGGTFTITGYNQHCTIKARSFRTDAIYSGSSSSPYYWTPANHWAQTTSTFEYYSKLSAPTFTFNSGKTKLTVQGSTVADTTTSIVYRQDTLITYRSSSGHKHENDSMSPTWARNFDASSTTNHKFELTASNTDWPTLVVSYENTSQSTQNIGRWRKMKIVVQSTSSTYLNSDSVSYEFYVYGTHYTGGGPTIKNNLEWNGTSQELVNHSLSNEYAYLDASYDEMNNEVLINYTVNDGQVITNQLYFEGNSYDYSYSTDNGTTWTSTVPSQTEPGTYTVKYKHNTLSETNVLVPTTYYNIQTLSCVIDRASIQSYINNWKSGADNYIYTYDGDPHDLMRFKRYDSSVLTIKYKVLFGRRTVDWGMSDTNRTVSWVHDPELPVPTSVSDFTPLNNNHDWHYLQGTEAGLYKYYINITVVDTVHYKPESANNVMFYD